MTNKTLTEENILNILKQIKVDLNKVTTKIKQIKTQQEVEDFFKE
jgi:hypothetical protein